jgi:hypothetical protein
MNNIFQLKSKICILIFIIGIQIIAFSQTVKTVGTGTTITEKYPFNGYYNNSWASSIYTASEINTSGTLNSIAFYIDNAPINYVMNNQRIYIKHTSANSYTSTAYSSITDFTLVYDGSITYNGTGWKTINLTTPFTYNGQDNLEILFENRDGSWSSGFPYFRYTTVSNVRTKRDYQDAQFPSLCYACATANTIPNIQLSFTNCTVQEGQITVSNNNIIPGNTTKLNLVNQSPNATIQWQESTDNVSFTNITGATSSSYTATIQQTKYFRAVVGINGCNKVTASAQVTANLTSIITKTIGNGTVISEKYPFNNYYDFSWASTIYKSSEIGTSGNLSRIAFQVANTPSLQTFQNQKIYVRTTTEAIISNTTYPTTAGFTLVYDGPITYNGSGWLEIVFNQQFYYNGTDNLEILYENRSNTYSLYYPTFYSTAMTENRTKRDYRDASFPTTCMYCSKVANLLNVQMKFIPCSTPSNTTASVESICNSGDVVLGLSSSLDGFLQWQSSTDNSSYTDIQNATTPTYTASNLAQTTYFRLKYSNGSCPIQYSNSKLITVTSLVSGTISTPSPLVNVGDAIQINLANQTTGSIIQWQESFDNIAFVDIQNSTQNSLTIPSFVESKYYRTKISKNNCVVYSNTLQLTVNESAWSTKIIGTGTTTFDKYPFNGYYDYSWANMLYKASEINTTGKLTRVSFYVDNSPVNEVMNNQKIYVRHSSTGQFSSTNYPTTAGFTLVYDGSITYNGSGWKEIIFTTPFNYNGVDDLEFLFENRDGSFSVNQPIFRGESGKSQIRVRRDYSDGSFPSTCVNCAYFGNVLNIKMKFAPCSIAVGTISTLNSTYKSGEQVTVNLSNQDVGSTVQWEQSFDNINYTTVSGETGLSYSFTMPVSGIFLRSVSTIGCSQYSNVLNISVDTCFTIIKTIGTGTSTTEKYPFNAYYNQSWLNVIYLSSEIGNKGKIASLSFNVKNSPDNYISENQKIYVRHTTLTGYADANYSGTSDFTLVYDGPISYNGTGWKEIILISPFE